ncbi:MAG: diguanylate cyclase [Anaerolineales bacterium]
MTPPNYLYSGLLLAAGLICLIVSLFTWQLRRPARGSVSLVVLLLALSWWDITYAIFWADLPGPTPYFWLDITYVGAVIVPTSLLIFALQLNSLENWIKPSVITILCVEPLLVTLALWSDPWHNLFFGSQREMNAGMILNGGAVFWGNVVYSYTLILMAFLLFLRGFFNSTGLYRKQSGMILLGLGFTWLNSIIFILGKNPLPGADNTPFSFTLTGLFFAHALFRYRLLDVVPIARSMLVDSMSDGIVVLDSRNRIVDMNPVAQGLLSQVQIGDPLEKIEETLPEIIRQFYAKDGVSAEVMLENPTRYLDFRISPVVDSRQQALGRLIVWRDITQLKLLQLELNELATRDMLTHAYNRRHFEELAEAEWARSVRFTHSMALVLLDIDHFKDVNDTQGHQTGDLVLAEFAKLCEQAKRDEDIFARWGGEEFIFLLPEADGKQAFLFAKRLGQLISETPIKGNNTLVNITCSLGVTSSNTAHDSLEAMFQRADQALYKAKSAGRNRAILWENKSKESFTP